MTLQRFQSLSQQAQQDSVKHLGVYLCERRSIDLTVFLYQIADFYTEVFFRKDTGKIVQVRSFAETDLLGSYLQEIDLSELQELLKV
ncbi:MAG: hypothetical protein JWP88_1217 [Flaviaesturariibacter sp.]|nr:hypothetical protein [Flaviaesturariibacter sp.]